MDISLHSFILVIGLMVITFIIWDGIKRVRELRSNQLDERLSFAEGDVMSEDKSYTSSDFDELEIADDLLQSDFIVDIPADKLAVDSIVAEAMPLDTVIAQSSQVDELPEIHAKPDDEAIILPVKPNVKAVTEIEEKLVEKKVEKKVEPPRKVEKEPIDIKVEPEEFNSFINDQDSVPVLMEPIELGEEIDLNPPKQQELHLREFIEQTLLEEPLVVQDEPEVEELDPLFANDFNDDTQLAVKPAPVGEKLSQRAAAQEIIVINIVKESEPLLQGADLFKVFKACDMRHGEMDVFHRFEKPNAQGKIQFSAVNVMKPGGFDLKTIDEMKTPGISLFMSLPGPESPMQAFDAMSEVALVFSRNFNASLYDDSHSDLTPQTLEHYRSRIREYSRKHIPLKK